MFSNFQIWIPITHSKANQFQSCRFHLTWTLCTPVDHPGKQNRSFSKDYAKIHVTTWKPNLSGCSNKHLTCQKQIFTCCYHSDLQSYEGNRKDPNSSSEVVPTKEPDAWLVQSPWIWSYLAIKNNLTRSPVPKCVRTQVQPCEITVNVGS